MSCLLKIHIVMMMIAAVIIAYVGTLSMGQPFYSYDACVVFTVIMVFALVFGKTRTVDNSKHDQTETKDLYE